MQTCAVLELIKVQILGRWGGCWLRSSWAYWRRSSCSSSPWGQPKSSSTPFSGRSRPLGTIYSCHHYTIGYNDKREKFTTNKFEKYFNFFDREPKNILNGLMVFRSIWNNFILKDIFINGRFTVISAMLSIFFRFRITYLLYELWLELGLRQYYKVGTIDKV